MADENAVQMDMPEYALSVQPDTLGKLWMGLVITTSSITQTIFLCRSNNYEETAQKLHKGIMEAGRQMRRAESGLVAVNGAGDIDAVVQIAKGRKQQSPRRTRP